MPFSPDSASLRFGPRPPRGEGKTDFSTQPLSLYCVTRTLIRADFHVTNFPVRQREHGETPIMSVGPDNDRFTRHWTQAQPVVASYINSMVPDFHAAEDLLQ